MKCPILPKAEIIKALEALNLSDDRVVLERDNQKQGISSPSLGRLMRRRFTICT
jgi:hypothetical protein